MRLTRRGAGCSRVRRSAGRPGRAQLRRLDGAGHARGRAARAGSGGAGAGRQRAPEAGGPSAGADDPVGRDVPALYLAAEDDTPIPLAGVCELFDRTPEPKRMFVLRLADHQHFLDDVEGEHEALRAMTLPAEAAWIPAAMQPITQLCPGEHAHVFVRGLTLGQLDATLRGSA